MQLETMMNQLKQRVGSYEEEKLEMSKHNEELRAENNKLGDELRVKN